MTILLKDNQQYPYLNNNNNNNNNERWPQYTDDV